MMRWLFAVCFSLLPGAALAQGWIEPLPRPLPQPARVERVRTSVTVRVTDRIARVQVEEWFRNNGTGLGEGDYLYPLPGEAVFSDFSLLRGAAAAARSARTDRRLPPGRRGNAAASAGIAADAAAPPAGVFSTQRGSVLLTLRAQAGSIDLDALARTLRVD